MSTIRISASESEPSGYDVIIEADALQTLPSVLARVAPAHRYALLTDSNVAPHWGDAVLASLSAAGLQAEQIVFAAGEPNKTRDTWSLLTDRMLELGVNRLQALLDAAHTPWEIDDQCPLSHAGDGPRKHRPG